MHRLIARTADRLLGRDNALRLAVTPIYAQALYLASGGRGIPWAINGETFLVDPRFRYLLPAVTETDAVDLMRRRVSPGSTVLNVGANVGVYVLQLARIIGGGGRIVAFEPNAGTAAILRRHVRMNRFETTVVVENLAVGATAGVIRLFDMTPGSAQSRVGAPHPIFIGRARPRSVDVPMITIDDYCREHRLEPDWIVVDVEGHEIDVLRGAADTIRRRPSLAAVVEVHPDTWHSLREGRARLASVLEDLGLQASALTGQQDPLAEYGQVLLTHAGRRSGSFSAPPVTVPKE